MSEQTKPHGDQSTHMGNVIGSQVAIHSTQVTQTMKDVGVAPDILKRFEALDAELAGLSKTDPMTAQRIQGAANMLKNEVVARPQGAATEGKPKATEQEKAWWKLSADGLKAAALAVKDFAPTVWQAAKDLADNLLIFFGI